MVNSMEKSKFISTRVKAARIRIGQYGTFLFFESLVRKCGQRLSLPRTKKLLEPAVIIDHERSTLNAGELVTVEHQNVHCLESTEDNLFLSVHIDLKETKFDWETIQYYYFSCSTRYCFPHQQKAMAQIIDILLSAAYMRASKKFEVSPADWRKICDALIKLLIDHFLWFAVEDLTSEENKKFRERLIDILTYTQKHYKEKITIKQLAQMEYINENYLSQFLKRTSFHSFTLMLNYVRCFEAQKMLLNTDKSIQEISDACGFSSKKYFHKHFKFYWNTTPLQLRKWYQEYTLRRFTDLQDQTEDCAAFLQEYITALHMKRALETLDMDFTASI